MRRRKFLSLAACTAAWPMVASAQSPESMRRIGLLMTSTENDPLNQARIAKFLAGLKERGWIENRNFKLELKYAGSKLDDLPMLAADLVRSRVDLIVTGGTEPIQVASKATASIPVVMTTIGDPIAAGVVQSLARPGGNVTGLSLQATELSAKRLEQLKEMLPALTRVAVLWNPNNESVTLKLKEIEAAAKLLKIEVRSLPIRAASDIEKVLKPAEPDGTETIMTTEDALQVVHRVRLVGLATQRGIPVASEFSIMAHAGALMSYGPSLLDQWSRATYYVDKILKGTKPADLPVQQPTHFEFLINLKSAKALNIAVPPMMLARADEVIQ